MDFKIFRQNFRTLTTFTIVSFCGLILCLGCSEDETTSSSQCDENAELHGDHCHCNAGYHMSDDDMTCIPDQDTDHADHENHEDHEDHEDYTGEEDNSQSEDEDETDANQGTSPEDENQLDLSSASTQANVQIAQDNTKVWQLTAQDGNILLGMEIYESFGGVTTPGTVELTDKETDYASCGTCLILQTGCNAHGDHFHCEHTFMPRAEGQVRIDDIGSSLGESLSGQLSGLVFQEVSIDDNYQTVPVVDGEIRRLDSWSFNVSLESSIMTNEECGGHGQLHGEHCHCDQGYRPSSQDPTQCIPE